MYLYEIHETDRFHEKHANYKTVDIRWVKINDFCKKCLLPMHWERAGPLTIEWVKGSDLIPDFIMAHMYPMVVDRVKIAFEQASLRGYEAWPVKIREPKKVPRRPRIPRVPSPYPGPPLWDIHVTERVHVIPEESTLNYDGQCPKCGRFQYSPYSIGPGKFNFIVDGSTWNGGDFMYPEEVGFLFVTQRVIDVIEANKFSNVEYRRVGEIQT